MSRAAKREVGFEPGEIVVARGWGDRRSSVHGGARIPASGIREVRCDRFPPELVLASGEVVFVPKREEAALDLFARVHGIPRVTRHDVSADLLEPYLDTEFEPEQQARTLGRLEASGLARAEIEEIRALIGEPMLRYNALLWDWVHLGHLDLLAAMAGALPRAERQAFYTRSMAIANRGRLIQEPAMSALARARMHWYEVESAIGAAIGSTQTLLDELLERYAEPHRAYHGQAHLLAVVEGVTASGLEGRARSTVLLAAWFHDAVYRPGAIDNEGASAALLCERVPPHTSVPRLVEAAAELVRGTAHPFAARGQAAEALADADLAILAEEDSVYRRYAEAIRVEHAALSEEAFRAGRIAFLREVEATLGAGKLFHTLHPLHESLARANLAAELGRLRGDAEEAT